MKSQASHLARPLLTAAFTLLATLFAMPLSAQPKPADSLDARQLPAVTKSPSGPKQRIQVVVKHSGNPAPDATIALGTATQKVALKTGRNYFTLEIPVVNAPTPLELTLTVGGKTLSKSVTVKPVRLWKLNFVQHTHTDIGYTRSQTEILAEHPRFIDYALDYCDATDHLPDDAKFRWTCEVTWPVNEYLKSRPAEQIARLKKRVDEGRIEITAMYLNFDELPDEQTLAASLAPLKQIRAAGFKTEVAMQDDVNGIGWCFNEFFNDLGVKYVNMGINQTRSVLPFALPTIFWWESPSGKKILTYRAEHYMHGNRPLSIEKENFPRFEARVLEYLASLEAKNYPFDIAVSQHSGYFTDNSPPSTKSSEMIRRWNEKYEWPKLRSAVVSEFYKEIEKNYADKIQTIRGAWPDWWTDGFGSGAREAAATRAAHSDVIAQQAALSLSKILGAKLPSDVHNQIFQTNDALLFYDEHTFGSSDSVGKPYGHSAWDQRSLKQSYAWEAYRRSGILGETASGLLQSFVSKSEHPSLVVFNTLNWSYSGIAKAYIDHQILPPDKQFEIIDSAGRVLPVQAGEVRTDGTYWAIYVKDIPAFGYAQYSIRILDLPRCPLPSSQEGIKHVENKWYSIDFDLSKGTIHKLFDKELNKELLTPDAQWGLGEFIYERLGARRTMHEGGKSTFTRTTPSQIHFTRYIKGPIWDTYRFQGDTAAGRESNNLTVEFRVYSVTKKIEILHTLRKRAETEPEAVYVSFPFAVENGKIHADVPGGTMEAGVEQIPGSSNDWNTVQNFVTIRNAQSQVVLCSPEIPLWQFGGINSGRFKTGALPQSTNIYSWPMNNYWYTNFNADQIGEFQWTYQINSTADSSLEYATRFGWANRIPFLTRVLPGTGKPAPLAKPESFLSIKPDNLLLVNMTPVEGERAVLLQLREIAGKKAVWGVSSPKVVFKSTVANVLGEPLAETAEIVFAPLESKFIKLTW